MHPRKPIKKPQANVQVDLREADTIKCDDCGNYLFITSFILKRLSALLSPSGEEALIPVQVYSCGDCGKVPNKLLDGTGLETDPVPTLEV
jgi:DNA-directed RNA polymerase subunit RPC12/RpoP